MEDEDFLSPEEIEAATKKVTPCYYAYYNDAGDITDISSSLLDNKDTFLQISFEIFEKFITGQEQFKDWVVSRTKNSTNEFGVEIVNRLQQSQTFKNNMFERVTVSDNSDAEVTVHWDGYNKKWIFILNDAARQRVYDNKIGTKKLSFFITYESTFDFLIRTIEIPVSSLVADKVEIEFCSTKESEIRNINLSTKHAFDNYSLVIWEKNEQQDTSD